MLNKRDTQPSGSAGLKRTHFAGGDTGQEFQPEPVDYSSNFIVNVQGDPVQIPSGLFERSREPSQGPAEGHPYFTAAIALVARSWTSALTSFIWNGFGSTARTPLRAISS